MTAGRGRSPNEEAARPAATEAMPRVASVPRFARERKMNVNSIKARKNPMPEQFSEDKTSSESLFNGE